MLNLIMLIMCNSCQRKFCGKCFKASTSIQHIVISVDFITPEDKDQPVCILRLFDGILKLFTVLLCAGYLQYQNTSVHV